MVDGIVRLMESRFNEPVNLGNPEELSILSLAKLIIKLSGTKSRIVYRPLPEDDPKVRKPNIDRAKEVLGWEPKVTVEEGLQRTIAWFSSRGK
jgi:nucleoside-diphosphate-sugar epimerase